MVHFLSCLIMLGLMGFLVWLVWPFALGVAWGFLEFVKARVNGDFPTTPDFEFSASEQ